MRTLKKALCLVLAVVTVLGLGVFSTASAEFTDADKVSPQYKEAVDVLETLNVLRGNGSGAVNPQDTFTRAEGAVMIVRLMDYDDSKLSGVSTFSDVPDWAQPSVALLESNGIVAGNGSGKFLADQPMTGVAYAKMLLGVLEYDADIEGMANAGEQWVINTVKLAKSSGVADDVMDYVNDTNITREVAAKMTLNALKAEKVEYSTKGTTVTVNGVDVTTGASKATAQTGTDSKYGAIKRDGVSGTASSSNPFKIQLGEELFKGDLRLTESQDKLGNKDAEWSYKAKDIGTYPKSPDASFTGKVTFADLYDAMGSTVAEHVSSTKFYVDGEKMVYNSTNRFIDSLITRTNNDAIFYRIYGTGTSFDDVAPTGNGAVTNVYWDYDSGSTGYDIIITVTNYYLMKANADYNTSKDNLTVDIYSTTDFDKGTIEYYGSVKIDGKKFPEVVDASKDDKFIVTFTHNNESGYNDEIIEILPVDTMTGVAVTSFRSADSVVVDGTTYKYNQSISFEKITGTTTVANGLGYALYKNNDEHYKLDGSLYDFYLDPNGYIIGVEANNGSTKAGDYIFVKDATKNGFDYSAKIVRMDGTEETVVIEKINGEDPTGVTDGTTSKVVPTNSSSETVIYTMRFYTFTVRSNGNYRIEGVKVAKNIAEGSRKYFMADADAGTSSVKVLTANSSKPILAKAAYKADNDFGTDPIQLTANSKTVTVANKTAYVGVASSPNVSISSGTATVYYLYEKESTLIAIYTSIEGYSEGNENLIYIFNNGDKATQAQQGDDTYYIYDIVDKDGNFADDFYTDDSGNRPLSPGLYDVRSYNKDNWAIGDNLHEVDYGAGFKYGAFLSLYDSDDASANRNLNHSDGVLTVHDYFTNSDYTYALSSDVTIYLVTDLADNTPNEVEEISAARINTLDTGAYAVYIVKKNENSNNVETVYIVQYYKVPTWLSTYTF